MTRMVWCNDAKMSTTEELVNASPLTENWIQVDVSAVTGPPCGTYIVQFDSLVEHRLQLWELLGSMSQTHALYPFGDFIVHMAEPRKNKRLE